MEAFLQEAKASSRVLSTLSGTEKNSILRAMAQGLRDNKHKYLKPMHWIWQMQRPITLQQH